MVLADRNAVVEQKLSILKREVERNQDFVVSTENTGYRERTNVSVQRLPDSPSTKRTGYLGVLLIVKNQNTFAKRSRGDPEGLPEIYRQSLTVPVSSILSTYLSGSYLTPGRLPWLPDGWRIPYAFFAVALATATALVVLGRRARRFGRKVVAAHVAAWFSLLCPLSWFVVFKAHCYIHEHLDFLVWELPFVPFAMAAVFMTVSARFSPAREVDQNSLGNGDSTGGGGATRLDSAES